MNEDILETSRILPVVVINDSNDAIPLAEALLAGGLNAVEITFRSKAAQAAIAAIRSSLPEMIVSAGTVVTQDQAMRAIDAGAHFGLAPGFDAETVSIFNDACLPFVPGIMTPTDVQAALKSGCTYLKFFPAEAAGGISLLKSLIAPYKSMGVKFCPTGGLKLDNMSNYFDLPEVFAIGGTWLAKPDQIANKQWSTITIQVQQALNILL